MKLIKLNAIDSTNDYLKALHRKVVLEDEVIVIAHHQTKGRGQAASTWYSKPNKSLSFSMFKRFGGVGSEWQFAINWAVSLGIKSGLEDCGIQKVMIKWPNDILADGRKICGILIENQWQAGMMNSSIIGVGVNVNKQDFPNLPQATSLALAANMDFDISVVFKKITDGISSELIRFVQGDYESLKQDYERNLFRINTFSEFENNQGIRWKGRIKGVSDNGLLKIKLENGSLQLFEMKQIRLVY